MDPCWANVKVSTKNITTLVQRGPTHIGTRTKKKKMGKRCFPNAKNQSLPNVDLTLCLSCISNMNRATIIKSWPNVSMVSRR